MTEWAATPIPGALTARLVEHSDTRGSFMELWRQGWTDGLPDGEFRQANLSRSRAGVLRGMHFHRRQADLWIVAEGSAFAALLDLRPVLDGSAQRPPAATVELRTGSALYLPRLVAHGFYALADLALIYLVTREFDGSDELGFAWDDPELAIEWPSAEPVLSDRDRSNPSLADALGALGQDTQSEGR